MKKGVAQPALPLAPIPDRQKRPTEVRSDVARRHRRVDRDGRIPSVRRERLAAVSFAQKSVPLRERTAGSYGRVSSCIEYKFSIFQAEKENVEFFAWNRRNGNVAATRHRVSRERCF